VGGVAGYPRSAHTIRRFRPEGLAVELLRSTLDDTITGGLSVHLQSLLDGDQYRGQ
jgi:hypothetical protein